MPDAPDRALLLDPRTYDRALACVHCGLCLPACPTYVVSGHEADSPRGRIQLMRGLADELVEATPSVRHHLDLCLDCRACETACPSGVVYHELIEETRWRFTQQEGDSGFPKKLFLSPACTCGATSGSQTASKPGVQTRLMRWLFFHLLTHPTRLKLALLPVRLLQKIGLYALLRKSGLFKLLPAGLRKMEQMLPATGPLWPARPSPAHAASGEAGGATKTVAFFAGCIGSVMFDRVNRQAVELLAAAGAEVRVPLASCCGAIHHHSGAHAAAQALARRTIDAFIPPGVSPPDFITTTIAGCGAMLREYDVLLRDDVTYADRARDFAGRVRDVSEVLLELGLHKRTDLLKHSISLTITYHDACHLAHAQKVTAAPRELLAAIPGLTLVPLGESDMCCGAAGTYNLTQPEMAAELANRKLRFIAATGAGVCVTGNVGCVMHLQSQAIARGQKLTLLHPVELLHQAVFGLLPLPCTQGRGQG